MYEIFLYVPFFKYANVEDHARDRICIVFAAPDPPKHAAASAPQPLS
jgi:hypothetical protein